MFQSCASALPSRTCWLSFASTLQEIAKTRNLNCRKSLLGAVALCQFSLASLTNLLFLELAHNFCQTFYLGKHKRPRNNIFLSLSSCILMHYKENRHMTSCCVALDIYALILEMQKTRTCSMCIGKNEYDSFTGFYTLRTSSLQLFHESLADSFLQMNIQDLTLTTGENCSIPSKETKSRINTLHPKTNFQS